MTKLGLKYTLRTATMKTDYSGTHKEGLRFIFMSLDFKNRQEMLITLAKAHDDVTERESARATGVV